MQGRRMRAGSGALGGFWGCGDMSKEKQKNCPVKWLVTAAGSLVWRRENSEGRVSLCYWILSPVQKGYLGWTPNAEGKGWPAWPLH